MGRNYRFHIMKLSVYNSLLQMIQGTNLQSLHFYFLLGDSF